MLDDQKHEKHKHHAEVGEREKRGEERGWEKRRENKRGEERGWEERRGGREERREGKRRGGGDST